MGIAEKEKILKELLHRIADEIGKQHSRLDIIEIMLPGFSDWFHTRKGTHLTPYEGGTAEEQEKVQIILRYLAIEASGSETEQFLSAQLAYLIGIFWKEKIEKPELIKQKEKKDGENIR